ncbi:MAG: insulinase family protein [Chitinispirillaceae bacterium]|nr:insulinase family protein [Chitinispirillaceae bacterium]
MLLDNIAEQTFGNGLKVICLQKKGAPIAAVQIWYRTGSARESGGLRGISHFLEHMMFRGSRELKSEEHARRINDVGGHCNAFTAEDVTAYHNSVPRDFLDMAVAMEAEEYHTYMNNPMAKAFLEFRREFYGEHPYAISPLGLIEDVTVLTANQLCDYYNRYYTPDNATMVVVGDITPAEVFESAHRHFDSKVPLAGRTATTRLKASRPEGILRMKRKVEFDVPVMVMGYPAPPSSHEDAVALEILQMVIAGGETSRLHREVVRRQSLAVMAGGMNHLLKNSGMSMFFAAFTPDTSVERLEQAIGHEISRIRSDGITPEELEKVRNITLTHRTFELYSADNICQRIAYGETIEGDYRLWVRRLDALKNLDRDRLITVARTWWDDSKKHLLLLKPRRSNVMLYIGGLMRRTLTFMERNRNSGAAS